MKITRLQAENVHGYLPINIEFFSDLTFLTGVNGTGKTSALQLLMALLTPRIEAFSSISFTSAVVTTSYEDREVIVSARKSSDGLQVATSSVAEPLFLTNADLELLLEVKEAQRREETRSPIHEKISNHDVYKAIRKMTTPMFLGLDRRFSASSSMWDESEDLRRREYYYRRAWIAHSAHSTLSGSGTASLQDVFFLIMDRMQEILTTQEGLDDTLRSKLLASAFEYKPADIASMNKAPSRPELEGYRKRLEHISRTAEDLRVPIPDKTKLAIFLEKLSKIVDALEKPATKPKKQKSGKSGIDIEKDLVEWFFNKTQAEKILEHLQLLDQYGLQRSALREPLDRFVNLTNSFLKQTSKQIAVTGKGELSVYLEGSDKARPISALSSGERQLLVMLAHLSLNKNLIGSGVFIVDEPELSLHIDWQERFVDAIREANPNVQLIMATHSPAIILDRIESCVSLDGKHNA